jgi:hypothetical protein
MENSVRWQTFLVSGSRSPWTIAIEWTSSYRIDGPAFVYEDSGSGRVTSVLGYPVAEIHRACRRARS